MNLPYIGADKKPCIYVTMTTANRTAQIELKWAKYKKSVPGTLSTRPYYSSPQMQIDVIKWQKGSRGSGTNLYLTTCKKSQNPSFHLYDTVGPLKYRS
jgi:hypothetical protein